MLKYRYTRTAKMTETGELETEENTPVEDWIWKRFWPLSQQFDEEEWTFELTEDD